MEEVIKLIDRKIQEISNEAEPTYCGLVEFREWSIANSSQIEVLEDLKYEIQNILK